MPVSKTPATKLDDEFAQLVARAQEGDRAAITAIYERFADAVFRYLYSRCGNVTVAEDLASDLWLRVVERLPTFRFKGEQSETVFAAWIFRIAANLTIDTFRSRKTDTVPLTDDITSHTRLPDEQVVAGEEHAELRAAIEQLTVDQREVLLLRFVSRNSNAEVARLLGRTEGSVKLLQHRALGALARMLGVSRGRRD